MELLVCDCRRLNLNSKLCSLLKVGYSLFVRCLSHRKCDCELGRFGIRRDENPTHSTFIATTTVEPYPYRKCYPQPATPAVSCISDKCHMRPVRQTGRRIPPGRDRQRSVCNPSASRSLLFRWVVPLSRRRSTLAAVSLQSIRYCGLDPARVAAALVTDVQVTCPVRQCRGTQRGSRVGQCMAPVDARRHHRRQKSGLSVKKSRMCATDIFTLLSISHQVPGFPDPIWTCDEGGETSSMDVWHVQDAVVTQLSFHRYKNCNCGYLITRKFSSMCSPAKSLATSNPRASASRGMRDQTASVIAARPMPRIPAVQRQ